MDESLACGVAMRNGKAAVRCPRCPSDSADWQPMFGMDPENHERVVLVGNIYRCMVCSVKWIESSGEPAYIPDPDYWDGNDPFEEEGQDNAA